MTLRVLILNPNSDAETEEILRRTAERFVGGRYEFDVVSMKTAPKLVVSYEDQSASAAELAAVVRQNRDRYDAFVLACHGDPNLDLVREIAGEKPVYGIAEASMHMAAIHSGGFAVLSPDASILPKKVALARKYHLEGQLKAVVVSRGNDRGSLLAAAQEALACPAVGAIVLGCANYAGSDAYLQKRLGVPVYDGLIWALILAEGAARSNRYQKEAEG